MNTLSVSIFLTIFAIVLCDKTAEMQQQSRACMESEKVSEAEIKSFYTNGMNPAEAKEPIKCFMKCVMEKQGHLKAGVFSENDVIKSLREIPQLKDQLAEIEAAVKKCKNEKGANDCDTAFKINMCLKEYKSSATS